ncbi:MAG: hypothetical protein WCP85_09680, partial [Mariniphaga sp.]
MKKLIISIALAFTFLTSNCNAGNPVKTNVNSDTSTSGSVIVLTNEVFKQKVFNYAKNKEWKYE